MAGQAALENQLLQAASVVESFVDAELTRMDNMDGDELEQIRQSRLKEMKKLASRKDEWIQIGHGQYQTLKDASDFFEEQKKSERFICHFYRDATFRCKIVDKHMEIIAKKHIESRFTKLDAEKCMWLCQKLHVKVLPTIVCIQDGKTKDFIVGFDQLGGTDDFPTEMLEWRLGLSEMINHSGEKPVINKKGKVQKSVLGAVSKKKKTIRGGDDDDSDDDDDY